MTRLVTLLCASFAAVATPAIAQQPAPGNTRPYRGLFGAASMETAQLLALNVSLGSGYTTNVFVEDPAAGTVAAQRPPNSGFGSVAASLSYSLNRTKGGVTASLATTSRYYPRAFDNFSTSYSGDVGVSYEIASDTRFAASHTMIYQPFRTFGVLSGSSGGSSPAFASTQDLLVDRVEYSSQSSSIALTHQLSRRAGLALSYARQAGNSDGAGLDFTSHGPSAAFNYAMARGFGVRVGYGFIDSSYHAASQPRASTRWHNIDAGLYFNRALSFSRRATLSFGTGSAVITELDGTRYRLNGHARFNYDIGRTWQASAEYSRGVGFAEAFQGPVSTDSVVVSFGGLVNRRVQFQSRASTSRGIEFGSPASGNGFDTYSGWAGFTFGISRHLGLGTNYSYYYHSFNGVAPGAGWFTAVHRHTVGAYLSVWTPLWHRTRRPDAAR